MAYIFVTCCFKKKFFTYEFGEKSMNKGILGRSYNDKNAQKAVVSAWEDLLTNGECKSSAIRAVIKNSWQRCLAQGVDQIIRQPAVADNLEELRQDNGELVSALKSIEDRLSDVLSETDSLIALADSNGMMMEVFGNSKVIESAKYDQIMPGYAWNENTIGTNAIGTAIELKQPVEIHAAEHFCESIKRWSCAAAPVMDPLSGELLGVIDVTTSSEKYSIQNIALAITAAQQLEENIQSRQFVKRMLLVDWYHEVGSQWRNDGLVLLDCKGRVIKTNPYAEKLLSGAGAMAELSQGTRLTQCKATTLEQYAEALPETVRPLSLESFNGSGQWQGGILVVDSRCSARPQYSIRCAETDRISPEQVDQAFQKIISRSQMIEDVKVRARRIAMTDAPVLVLGETGCGKELFANAIHDASAVADKPFIAVNCGTFIRELASSELFGYEGGAFTGASPKGRAGKFEEANGGTIFLDEIGELAFDLQVALLRILQDGIVVRVGGIKKRKVNARIIAATNRDLAKDVEVGRFRKDLYYRLKVMTLSLPPLREHPEDIDILASTFIKELAQKYNCTVKSIDPDLAAVLYSYDWPGNIREFKSALESMFVLNDTATLTRLDLPHDIPHGAPQETVTVAHVEMGKLCHVERHTILLEIERQDGNLSKVAKQLGIARSTLYRKMEEYHIGRS